MNEKIYLSVIIPAYNEEKLIKKTLLEVEKFLVEKKFTYEIIAVDDGSSDSTASILQEIKKSSKNLAIIQNNINKGKGYSVRKGILLANGKFRMFMDADCSASINQLEKAIPFLEEGYDVVIGSRKLEKSKIEKRQPFYKELLGELGNILIRIMAVSQLSDTQCGFKIFSEKIVNNFFPKLKIDRWGFDIEILAIAGKYGYKIKSVPIVWENRGESRVKLKDYFFTLKELLEIKINLIRKIYG